MIGRNIHISIKIEAAKERSRLREEKLKSVIITSKKPPTVTVKRMNMDAGRKLTPELRKEAQRETREYWSQMGGVLQRKA